MSAPDLGDLELGHARLRLFLIGFPSGREPGAFLAACVLAVDAHLVRTEGGLAPVTGAPHSHADRLGDSRELEIGGRLPLAGF